MKKSNQILEKIVKPQDLLGLEMSKIKGGTVVRCQGGYIEDDNIHCVTGKIK